MSGLPPALRTLIVDDEPLAIERLQILCARLPAIRLVGTAQDGEAALRLIPEVAPELILLDIGMPGLDGIAVAAALASRTRAAGDALSPAVIFVTAFDQFAVAAFEVSAVDYLLKPVTAGRLAHAIDRVVARREQAPARQPSDTYVREFWVPHGAEIIRIAVADLDLIEAERDYMRLHIGARSYLLHQTISELERRLDPEQFLRLHRSTIVPRDRIARLRHDGTGAWQAVLRGGRAIRIGRTFLARARSLLARDPGA